MPYEEGRPIPPGYHEETQIRKGLVIAGAAVFGGIYILTAIFTSVIISAEGEGEGYEALYAPLVGPWIAFGTIKDEINANGALILAASGVAQAGGVAMFIAGLAAKKKVLVRNDYPVGILVGPGTLGASLRF